MAEVSEVLASARIGVIGGGSMGGSIARGLAQAGVVAPERVFVCDHNPEKLQALADAAVMPNLPVSVRSGASAVSGGSSATADDVELTRTLFSALGAAKVMREDQLDAEGAVVGCAPAFFALMVDTLTRAGIRTGLPAAAAREMVNATMLGVAEMLKESGEHPRAYMERVTSPGGTTAAALYELEPLLAKGSYDAVDAALERTAELARS